MKQMERNRAEAITWLDWMVRLLRGGLVASVVTILGLLLGACCIAHSLVAQSQMDGIVLASCVVGTLSGSMFAMAGETARAIPMGLGVGLMLFLLCMTAGLIIYGNSSLGSSSVGVLCACLCGGMMAGVLCRGKKKKSQKKRV